jgi:hypothetical protein
MGVGVGTWVGVGTGVGVGLGVGVGALVGVADGVGVGDDSTLKPAEEEVTNPPSELTTTHMAAFGKKAVTSPKVSVGVCDPATVMPVAENPTAPWKGPS